MIIEKIEEFFVQIFQANHILNFFPPFRLKNVQKVVKNVLHYTLLRGVMGSHLSSFLYMTIGLNHPKKDVNARRNNEPLRFFLTTSLAVLNE